MGSIGIRHYVNTKKLLPNAEIKILRSTKNNKKYKEEINLQEAIKFNPNLVLINSPASKHFYYYKIFFKTNRAFFIEKPIDSSIKNIDFKLIKKANKFLMVGYILRFNNILLSLKKIISQNKYGKVKLVDIKVGQYLPDWRKNKNYKFGVSAQKKLGGGVLLELSHELDYATWLFGYPKKITALIKKLSDLDINVEDTANIIMDYDDKMIQISLDFLQKVAKMEMKIVFDNATIYVDLLKQNIKLFSKKFIKGKIISKQNFKNENQIYLKQMDYLFMRSFKNYKAKFKTTSKIENYANLKSSIKLLRLIEKMRLSSKTGKTIKI